MSKIAVIYWSGTGNTEAMADLVAQGIRAANCEADVFFATEFTADLVDNYEAFAFGCSAMGDEELEDTEFLPMYDEVEPLVGARPVALFGSYDWNDGEWMEYWEERCDDADLNVVDSVIAKDYPDGDAGLECVRLGTILAKTIA